MQLIVEREVIWQASDSTLSKELHDFNIYTICANERWWVTRLASAVQI